MKGIRAITFDFGGTLASGNLDKRSYRNALLRYLHAIGYSGSEAQLGKARKGMLERLAKARKHNMEIRFEDLYQGLLFKLGLHTEPEIIDHIHQLYVKFFKTDLIHGTEEVLKTLSTKYKIALISNAVSNIPRLAIEKYDLMKYFKVIVVSRDLGVRKPDPEIFRFTLYSMSIKSSEAVHVGDSLEHDVQGAKNVGIKTIWIRDKNETKGIQPDYSVNSIQELTSLL
jgi:putative hydrolase of the HAD superfamily